MQGLDITWAGGQHRFMLTIELLRALQQRCDAGPAWVLHRLQNSTWHVDDVISTIMLGLEGGGMDKDKARSLTQMHVEDAPITKSVLLAQLILMHVLYSDEQSEGEDQASGEAMAAAA